MNKQIPAFHETASRGPRRCEKLTDLMDCDEWMYLPRLFKRKKVLKKYWKSIARKNKHTADKNKNRMNKNTKIPERAHVRLARIGNEDLEDVESLPEKNQREAVNQSSIETILWPEKNIF